MSSCVSPNLVEPDSYRTEEETKVTLYSFAVIIPSTYKSLLTYKPLSAIDALALPLTILFNSNPVTPEAGMLYNPAPSPMNEDDIIDAVIGPLKLTFKDVSQIDPVNANKLSPEVPDVPLVPAVPDVPEVPSEPDVPEVPSEPLEPDVPLVPAVPDEPDVPEEPSLPLEPDVPLVPAVPDEPDVPEVPSEPLEPDVPEVPAVPDEPDVPLDPLPPTVAITVPACAELK